jgi:superfamily II DNA or RNA helicase
MAELRDYQEDLIGRARECYVAGLWAPVIVAPTGAGKTVIIAEVAQRSVARGTRVLILAHRRELIRQASEKLTAAGVPHGIIAPGCPVTDHLVQVGSVQTVARRLGKPEALGYGLIILDEAHHAIAGQWAAIIQANPQAAILGVTATPERLDGRGLGKQAGGFFDALVLGPSIADLQGRGFLCNARVFAPASGGPDMKGISKVAGDFDRGALEQVMGAKTITGDAVAHYRKYADGVPALVFCVSVRHAEGVAAKFAAAGYRAVAVSGETCTVERDAAIGGLATGAVQVLCTCDLISEGLDIPGVGCVILLRPTNSLCLHVQQVGRGLRPADNKPHLIILDHAGNTLRHGLPDEAREWSLDGRKGKPRTAIALKQCPACCAIHRPAKTCPECDHVYVVRPTKGRTLRRADGELTELTRTGPGEFEAKLIERERRWKAMTAKQLIAEATSLKDLQRMAAVRGWKKGWAWHAWSEKRGAPPQRQSLGGGFADRRDDSSEIQRIMREEGIAA